MSTQNAVLSLPTPGTNTKLDRGKFLSLLSSRGWTKGDLAQQTGIHPATLAAYERGARSPGTEQLLLLADALDVDPRDLWPTPIRRLQKFSESINEDKQPRWSISKVHDYLRCPALYWFRHIARAPTTETVTVDQAIGSAVHRGVEHLLRKRVGVPAHDPKESVRASLALDVPLLDVDKGTQEEAPDVPSLEDESMTLLQLYETNVAPTFTPVAAEQRSEIELGGAKFTVVLDTITDDAWVRDLKTSKRRPSQADIDESLQATAYSRGYRELTGEPSKGVAFDYLIRKKNPEAVTFTTHRDADDERRLERIVEGVIQAAGEGRFYPNPMNKFGCGTCPYRNECKATF